MRFRRIILLRLAAGCRKFMPLVSVIRGGSLLIAPSGRLFVADVGQDSFEEIDIVQKGGNYGWNIMEGDHCFNPPSGCNMAGLTLPITEISHPEGEAVIGGFVYHGQAIPAMDGMYVFGDLNGQDLGADGKSRKYVYAFTAHGCRIQHQFFRARCRRRVICGGYFGGTGAEDRADVRIDPADEDVACYVSTIIIFNLMRLPRSARNSG